MPLIPASLARWSIDQLYLVVADIAARSRRRSYRGLLYRGESREILLALLRDGYCAPNPNILFSDRDSIRPDDLLLTDNGDLLLAILDARIRRRRTSEPS